MMKMKFFATFGLIFLISACASGPKYVDGYATQKKQGDSLTLGLDREDFEKTAQMMITSMLEDPGINNISSRHRVLAIGRVVNDTAQRIDTEKLTAKITQALRKSGKFVLTSAVSAGGALDNLNHDVRELRQNDEFDQNSIAQKGTLIAPSFSLSGKIRQDVVRLSNGKTQVEYFFLLRMSDLKSGLVIWEDERTIDKIGSGKSVSW